jgi:FxsC-like protein
VSGDCAAHRKRKGSPVAGFGASGLPEGRDKVDAPYFFFSYAHTPRQDARDQDDPDLWQGKLFDDICEHILHLTDVSRDMVGFMDRKLRTGQKWPDKLTEALATARVFVPLYCPRFFASEDCGKEWTAFSQRMLNHAARFGGVDAIVPALWGKPPASLPAVARNIQFVHSDLNAVYGARGFYSIMKSNRYADDYRDATLALANQIIELAEGPRVLSPGAPAEYEKLENAFADVPWTAPGLKRVRFIILAPTANELPAERSAKYYGNRPAQWNPFTPVSQRSLAEYAVDIAKSLSYSAAIGDIKQDAVELLSAGPSADPQVLLIDPWVVRHEPCRRFLRSFSELKKPWVQMVVVCNEDDGELAVARDELMSALRELLPARLEGGRPDSRAAVNGLASLDDFGNILPSVIHAAARQFLQDAGLSSAGG